MDQVPIEEEFEIVSDDSETIFKSYNYGARFIYWLDVWAIDSEILFTVDGSIAQAQVGGGTFNAYLNKIQPFGSTSLPFDREVIIQARRKNSVNGKLHVRGMGGPAKTTEQFLFVIRNLFGTWVQSKRVGI